MINEIKTFEERKQELLEIGLKEKKVTFEEYKNSTILQTIYWLEEYQMFLWLAVDITKDERAQQKLQSMKVDILQVLSLDKK